MVLPGPCSATNSMNGSGSLTGSQATVPLRLRRRPPLSSLGSGAFFDFLVVGGGAFGFGIGPSSTPLDVGPLRAAFLTEAPDAARVRLRAAARVAMRLFGP